MDCGEQAGKFTLVVSSLELIFVNTSMGVLLRFRKDRIAIVFDVEGMFHQVRCAPKDRDALRIL